MQILLQALIADTAFEGKKPGAPIPTGDDKGTEIFAELLLPEPDAAVEVALEPLVIDAVPLQIARHPLVAELPVEALISNPTVVAAEAKPDTSQSGDGKAIQTVLRSLAVPATTEREPGNPLIDLPLKVVPIVAAFVPERPVLEQVPVSNAAAPEKTNQLTTDNSVKPKLTEPLNSPPDLRAIPEPDRVLPIQKDGLDPQARHGNLILEPRGPSEARVEELVGKSGRPDVNYVTLVAALPPERLAPEVKVPVEQSGRPANEPDQIRSEVQRLTAPIAAPVESQLQREPQVRIKRREARVEDRQSNGRDTHVATRAPVTPPSIALPSIAQQAVPHEQRTFGDVGQPTIEATTGLTSRVSEEIRLHASMPSRVEAAARPVITQIVHTITRSNLEGVIEVRLSPEELGRVKLAMSQAEVGITVHITAERLETLELMRRNIDMLESDLRDQGFKNLRFSFGQDGTEGRPEDETTHDRDDAPTASGLRVEVTPILAPIQDGRLDIRL